MSGFISRFWLLSQCCRRPTRGDEFGQEHDEGMSFAGEGQGAYTRETSYKFVGEGAGEFEMVPVPAPAGAKAKARCHLAPLCCGAILGLLGAAALVFGLWPVGSGAEGPLAELAAQAGLVFSAAPASALRAKGRAYDPYDCEDVSSALRNPWPEDKLKWCCSMPGRGCPETSRRGSTSGTPRPWGPPYNCTRGTASAWPPAMKEWCCEHKGEQKGLSCANLYDCRKNYERWSTDWPERQKAWCCRHKGRACHDCDQNYERWSTDWSVSKKRWCCKHAGRGCQRAPPNFVPATA